MSGLGPDFDLLHLNDAHVAPAATICATPSVLTIHNGAHQMGGDLAAVVEVLGLSHGGRNPAVDLEWHGAANFLKGGIVASRAVTTVSPTHGLELMDDATGFGLAPLLRATGLTGIMNGIDQDDWNPSVDAALAARYSSRSPARRSSNRKALLEATGLDDGVIFGNVGRMAVQKGWGLVGYYLGGLIEEGMRLVLVGNGEVDPMVDSWADDYPHAVAHLTYDEALVRLVYGGDRRVSDAKRVRTKWPRPALCYALWGSSAGCMPPGAWLIRWSISTRIPRKGTGSCSASSTLRSSRIRCAGRCGTELDSDLCGARFNATVWRPTGRGVPGLSSTKLCSARSPMVDNAIELPSLGESARCSPWSREQGISPAGTAIRADQLLLLDTPLPWPKLIRDHPRLVGMMDVAGAVSAPTRLLACRPVDDRIRLTVFRNVQGVGVRSTYLVPDDSAIPEAIASVACGDAGAFAELVEAPDVRASLLVCTQGTHDVCCGTDGVRFAAKAEQQLNGVDVYRVSHTGGHRFAPTAMTFPDGRMWAWLTTADIERIIARRGDHADLAMRCRGWWGADKGPQQVAELAVFTEKGWAHDASPRSIEDHNGTITITTPEHRYTIEVETWRTVPTISCRQSGGRPTKDATEYRAMLT